MIEVMDSIPVRLATAADMRAVGALFEAFQVEYGDVNPGAEFLGVRLEEVISSGDTDVVVGGNGPDGFTVLRFRPSLYSQNLECYLAELYVSPSRRGRHIGRAILEFALAHARARGADHIELGTSESDVAARRLYESLGFINTEGGPGGPLMYVYEREL